MIKALEQAHAQLTLVNKRKNKFTREPKIFWPKEDVIAWEALMMSAICCLVAKSCPTLLHEKSLLQEMTSYLTVTWNSWCIVLKQYWNPVLRTQNPQNDHFWPISPHLKGLNKTEIFSNASTRFTNDLYLYANQINCTVSGNVTSQEGNLPFIKPI